MEKYILRHKENKEPYFECEKAREMVLYISFNIHCPHNWLVKLPYIKKEINAEYFMNTNKKLHLN